MYTRLRHIHRYGLFFFAKKAYKKGFRTKLNSSHSKLTQIQFKLTKYDFTVAVLICLSTL